MHWLLNEPCARAKLGKCRFWEVVGVGGPWVNGFPARVEFFEGDFPSAGEDIRGEFIPMRQVVEVIVQCWWIRQRSGIGSRRCWCGSCTNIGIGQKYIMRWFVRGWVAIFIMNCGWKLIATHIVIVIQASRYSNCTLHLSALHLNSASLRILKQ